MTSLKIAVELLNVCSEQLKTNEPVEKVHNVEKNCEEISIRSLHI